MGNFFVDLQRATFLVLLPIAIIVASLMVFGGMPMTLHGAAHASTLEGIEQTIARGPVAAFLTIKQIGTNGGGFFGPNCTHPFENPTFWTNILASISIILIPMGCVWMFGRIVGRMRHAAVVFAVMLVFLLLKTTGAVYFEQAPTEAFAGLPIEQTVGNLEGKELRFGATAGPLWAVLTTCTSNGSVNCMHDSLNPLTGLMPMIGMWLNTTFGGVGVGMINMFLYIVLAVFVAGMMVGRTPEFLGRRIEAREVKLAVIALFAHAFFVLAPTALFAAIPDWGAKTLNNTGPHGFSEMLYEFSSANANNGSGFEGLGDNTNPMERFHRHHDDARAIYSNHSAFGYCRFTCRETADRGIGWNVRRRRRHFRRDAVRHDSVRWRIDIFPGRGARPDRRALAIHEVDHMRSLIPSIRLVIATMVICVAGYAALILGVARIVTPDAADGSLIKSGGR